MSKEVPLKSPSARRRESSGSNDRACTPREEFCQLPRKNCLAIGTVLTERQIQKLEAGQNKRSHLPINELTLPLKKNR